MIRVEGLEKIFHKNSKKLTEIHAIRQTSVAFEDTGLVCILGESGSGKTTLLNVIGGLEDFDQGEIQIDETKLKKYSYGKYEELRIGTLSYVFQNYMLLEEYTVEYNIRLALSPFDLSEEEAKERTAYAMEKLGILKLQHKLVSQLSGGQKQRVSIARAIVRSPKVIFADEPTGNLDEVNTYAIMNILKKLSKERLILMVTHNRHLAACYADRVITISKGRIIEDIHNTEGGAMQRFYDANLYLGEYTKKVIRDSNVELRIYGEPAQELILQVVWDKGKYYLQQANTGTECVILTNQSEMQMIDAPMKHYEEIEDVDFTLPGLPARKRFIPWKLIGDISGSMFRALGRRQLYLKLIFIICTLLLVLASASFFSVYQADKKAFISSDSHLVTVSLKMDQPMGTEIFAEHRRQLCEKIAQADLGELVIDTNYTHLEGPKIYSRAVLSFYGRTYTQLKLLSVNLTNHSIVPIDYLDSSAIIAGEMPKGSYEVVLDKWVADRILASDHFIFRSYHSYEDFIGAELAATAQVDLGRPLVITGICDSGEPTVYMNKYLMLLLMRWPERITYGETNLLQLIEEHIDQAGELERRMDSQYEEIILDCISYVSQFQIYTEDTGAVMDFLQECREEFSEKALGIDYYCKAEDQLDRYYEEQGELIKSITIAAVAIILLSVIIVYFTLQSYADSQKTSLMIYVILGIKRRNVILAYGAQLLRLMGYTILPVFVIGSVLIKVISRLKVLDIAIIYPLHTVTGILVITIFLYIVLALLPVRRMLRKPPAHIGLS